MAILISKGRNFLTRLLRANYKTSRSVHLPARSLRVYTEALTEFNLIYRADGLSDTLSEGSFLEVTPGVGTVGRAYIPRTDERVRSLIA